MLPGSAALLLWRAASLRMSCRLAGRAPCTERFRYPLPATRYLDDAVTPMGSCLSPLPKTGSESATLLRIATPVLHLRSGYSRDPGSAITSLTPYSCDLVASRLLVGRNSTVYEADGRLSFTECDRPALSLFCSVMRQAFSAGARTAVVLK